MYYLSCLQNGLRALDVAAGGPSLLRSLGVTNRPMRQLLREYMYKSSEVDKQKNSPDNQPPQSADSSQKPPHSADSQITAVGRISQVFT